ncbi:hypothetical protein [Campylobacter coli]|nr:hypothetical protein [Campylobacter coli]
MQKTLQIDLEKRKALENFKNLALFRIRRNNAFKFKRTAFRF